MNFYKILRILENNQSLLNLINNKEKTLEAFKNMEGEHTLKLKGNESIDGAIKWLKDEPEGKYVVYGDGGINRYFVYPNGSIKFSSTHAMYPSKETIKKAKELGFDIY